MNSASVELWGTRIGAVTWDPSRALGYFQYTPEFLSSGIEVAPWAMPLSTRVYSFPAMDRGSFHGLPGMLADVLPDRFGNALIDAWLTSQGRSAFDFNPVERLCYTGRRGMGALEFLPVLGDDSTRSDVLDLGGLVELANDVLGDREKLSTRLATGAESDALRDILRVGTSAGGARAKAVIAWNPETGEVRSGQVDAQQGFSQWLLKFDGVSENRDKELADPLGFGRIEFAYHLMALAAGIDMSECRLLEENGRAHFVTRRFDRISGGDKLHLQSLCALRHLDFNQAGAHSYEQCFELIQHFGLGLAVQEEQFRRMVFNVLARNQDDHTKNIAFLMDKRGGWTLSPAFDVTFAYNPKGAWTQQHQMSIQGKRGDFELADFDAVGRLLALKQGRARALFDEVALAVGRWAEFAEAAGVPAAMANAVGQEHRDLAL